MSTKSKTNRSRMVVLDAETLDPRTISFMNFFGGRLIGQPNADKMAQMIFEAMNNKARDKKRPIAVVAAIGPSRTGKSYSGKVIAGYVHNDESAVTELEGADYIERHQVLDLKGAPPTYVGGLTAKEKAELKPEDIDPRSAITNHNLRRVRLNSKSEINVVIINEFEKAHADFYKFWMGVFDKGYARLGDGEIVDFTNTIFILTMNLGMEEVERLEEGGMGFIQRSHKATQEEVADVVTKVMKKTYKKEFRNRLDAVVVFKPHNQDDLFGIVTTELNRIDARLTESLDAGHMFEIEAEDSAKQFLLDQAMADGGSVAELRRIIEKHVVTKLGRVMNKLRAGDKVVIFHEEGDEMLSFGLLEGEGHVSEADRMAARGERHSTGEGLTFQRRLHNAVSNHKKSKNHTVYALKMICRTESELNKSLVDMRGTLTRLFELKPINYFVQTAEAPYMIVISVRTTDEMVRLINETYPEIEVLNKEEPRRA